MRYGLRAATITATAWIGALLAAGGCGADVTVATFNIRLFPEKSTDLTAVAERLSDLSASIIAVQEIKNVRVLGEVLEEVSVRTVRDYQVLIGACGGYGREITTGVIYDAQVWTVLEHRNLPDMMPDGQCRPLTRPGTLGVFEDERGHRLGVMSVHLPALPHRFPERQEQWRRLIDRLGEVEREYDVPILALGDYNTTGFIGEPEQEREFVERTVDAAGYRLATTDLACSAYWRPENDNGPFRPSMLDHVVATRGQWTPARVHGMCERLACSPTDPAAMDPDFTVVSDHCPVVVSGRL